MAPCVAWVITCPWGGCPHSCAGSTALTRCTPHPSLHTTSKAFRDRRLVHEGMHVSHNPIEYKVNDTLLSTTVQIWDHNRLQAATLSNRCQGLQGALKNGGP